jgi:Divergent InlB B-repeat domain
VTVQIDGPGRLLSLPPAIDCPGKCAAPFAVGSWITLAATSGDGVSFVEWSRGCSGATGCGFTVTSDVDVKARFEEAASAAQKK